MKTRLALSVLLAILTSGCISSMITNSVDHANYSNYVESTNALNTDREKSGLQPVHVMTFEEWRGQKS